MCDMCFVSEFIEGLSWGFALAHDRAVCFSAAECLYSGHLYAAYMSAFRSSRMQYGSCRLCSKRSEIQVIKPEFLVLRLAFVCSSIQLSSLTMLASPLVHSLNDGGQQRMPGPQADAGSRNVCQQHDPLMPKQTMCMNGVLECQGCVVLQTFVRHGCSPTHLVMEVNLHPRFTFRCRSFRPVPRKSRAPPKFPAT